MGSIKKKRRAKMSKHKHDKRIKLERHKNRYALPDGRPTPLSKRLRDFFRSPRFSATPRLRGRNRGPLQMGFRSDVMPEQTLAHRAHEVCFFFPIGHRRFLPSFQPLPSSYDGPSDCRRISCR